MADTSTVDKPTNLLSSKVRAANLAGVLLIVTLILTLMGYWSFLGWPSDLASHFKAQYAVIQIVCLIIVVLKKRPQWILIGAMGLIPNLIELSQWFVTPDAISVAGEKRKPIKLMQMNVHTSNKAYDKVIAAIQQENPDIVSLQEVNAQWLAALKPVLKGYAYHVDAPREDNFGIALYSKIPFKKSKMHVFGKKDLNTPPSVMAAIPVEKGFITLISTHPLPPSSKQYYQLRDTQLFAIADARMELGQHLIIMGDLNTTAYSDAYKLLLEATGLRNANAGFGLQPTWPASFLPFWIPIDHVLVSENFTVLSHKTGPAIGSDHLPVVVELVLRPDLPSAPGGLPATQGGMPQAPLSDEAALQQMLQKEMPGDNTPSEIPAKRTEPHNPR